MNAARAITWGKLVVFKSLFSFTRARANPRRQLISHRRVARAASTTNCEVNYTLVKARSNKVARASTEAVRTAQSLTCVSRMRQTCPGVDRERIGELSHIITGQMIDAGR